jgi:hypothetical protein
MRRRWITVVASITVAAGSLAACGGSGGGAPHAAGSRAASPATTADLTPADALNVAYAKTASVSTMQVAIDGAMDVEGEHVPISGTGGVDEKARRMTMTMTMGPIGTIEMRMLGTTFYEKLPTTGAMASSPYAGKWIKIAFPANIQSAGSFDPRQALSYLEAVSTNGIHKLGSTTVRGDQTTHYSAQLDLTKVLDKAQQQLGSSTNLDLTQLAKQMGMQQLPMDVFIDGQHLVRRVAIKMQLTAPSSAGSQAGQHASFAINEDFDGYGTPVTVTAPPANQVVDGSGLLKGSLPGTSSGTAGATSGVTGD